MVEITNRSTDTTWFNRKLVCLCFFDTARITWHWLVHRKLEWWGYHVVKECCQYVKPFWHDTGSWQTGRQPRDTICCLSVYNIWWCLFSWLVLYILFIVILPEHL